MILKHSPVNSQKRVPIQRRVMRIVLITTLAALLVTGVTGMFCIAWVRDVTENVLTAQLGPIYGISRSVRPESKGLLWYTDQGVFTVYLPGSLYVIGGLDS